MSARFVVCDVPAGLRHGLFAEPGAYRALVRFSSSFARVRSDRWPDAHGMAIKVFGPAGRVQDFVLANNPVFFVANATDYVELLDRGIVNFMLTRPRELVNLLKATLGTVRDPLTATYFSQTPYACGSQAVKYRAAPVGGGGQTAGRGYDRLADVLAARLQHGGASFELAAQRRLAGEPIDDARVRWRGALEPIARVEIASQVPSDGERLSFSPGHTLPEHVSLGSINEARVAVYDAIAARRTQLNAKGTPCSQTPNSA